MMSSWQPSASLRALQARAEGLAQIRAFFAQRGVLEVQTPVLGSQTVTDPNVESIPVPGYGFFTDLTGVFHEAAVSSRLR